MTDKLIEAVARAIREQVNIDDYYGTAVAEEDQTDAAIAAIAAIEASGSHRVVPVEPTAEMATAMLDANIHPPHQSDGSVSVRAQNAHIYAAMLAAAPKVGE